MKPGQPTPPSLCEALEVHWSLRPGRVVACLWLIVAALVAASLAVHVAKYVYGVPNLQPLIKAFDLDEGDVPAFVAGSICLFSAAACAAIGSAARPKSWRWKIAAAGLLLLAIDRAAALHAVISLPPRSSWGAITYVGTLIALIAAAMIVWLCVRLLLSVPGRIAIMMLIAAALFAIGAFGLQQLEASSAIAHGRASLVYALLTDAEELLELAGTLILLHALLLHLRQLRARIVIA